MAPLPTGSGPPTFTAVLDGLATGRFVVVDTLTGEEYGALVVPCTKEAAP